MTRANGMWKADGIDDLTNRARFVVDGSWVPNETMSARSAARVLSGIVGLIARRWTPDEMQLACAELVRCDEAWTAKHLGRLPNTSEPMQLLAVVVRSILPLAGIDNTRAALSFWATENDPAVWTHITAE